MAFMRTVPVAKARKRKHVSSSCCRRRRGTGQCALGFKVVDTGVHGALQRLATDIDDAYLPCRTTYLDAKGEWNISCYAELASDLPDLMVPGAVAHQPLQMALGPILPGLTKSLEAWWHEVRPEKRGLSLRRVQTFVTKYSAVSGQSHLTRHVDGPQVHASMILQLHSPKGFEGGGVTVWDRQQHAHFLQLQTGQLCMLDHLVWHQSHPVTAGERWVLVIFCHGAEAMARAGTVGRPGGVVTCDEAISLANRAADGARVDAVVTRRLMMTLEHGGEEEKERAAFCLGCLAASGSENRTLMVECGVLRLLAVHLKRAAKPANERAWIIATLGRLASGAKFKGLLAAEGIIPSLIDVLQHGTDLEKEETASALCNLAANHEANKDAIISSGASAPLVRLLEGTEKQREWAANTLSNLAAGSAGPPGL